MKLYAAITEVPETPLVLAAGAFDGVHRGHAAVIRTASEVAARHGADTGVLRFFPHPAKILYPESAPHLLTTEEQLAGQLEEQGVQLQLRMPFTPELSKQPPETFLDTLFSGLPGLRGMVVGANWRFGAHGKGDVQLLQRFAAERDIEVVQAPDTEWHEVLISSTRIRQAVADGHLEAAATMLGRPYQLTGTVEHGKKFGRTLGFPTANLSPEQECLPPPGVYAMRVGIGTAPNLLGAGYITHTPPLCEVHLLDFEGDLYGKPLQVDLLSYERPATPIPDPDALRTRIEKDIQGIRAKFTGNR